jgi:hypothetical protein
MASNIRLSGSFTIDEPIATAFPLFSPEGELAWAPEWKFENVHPIETWSEGQVFRAGGTVTGGVWVVARLDHDAHRVTYYRVEGNDLVARIDVACDEDSPARTRVAVTYAFVALSPAGDQAIAGMSQEAYEGKMKDWKKFIGARASRPQ